MFMIMFSFLLSMGAQTLESYQIKWMGQYPGEKGTSKVSFGDRVSRIVFGQKAQEVVKPFNIVVLDPEHYWILDQGAAGVFEVKDGRGSLIKAMKKGEHDYNSMVGICRMPDGDLLFTDSGLDKVVRISGEHLQSFGDLVHLDQPTGIAYNPISDHIWVVETGSHRIALFNREGQLIRKLGGRGTGPGFFNFPTFIWIDRGGRVYVVDSMNFRIQVLDSEGRFLSAFGESGDATGFMARPKGVATDSKGHIYVADALFHVVQIFDREGNFLYSFGSQGKNKGEFWMPSGICIDEQDHIYVADSYNARVQVFQLEKNGKQ